MTHPQPPGPHARDPAPTGRRAAGPPSRAAVALAWGGAGLFAVSLAWFLYSYAVRFGRPATAGSVVTPVLVNVALFSAFAFHHSLLARDGVKAALQRWMSPAAERSLYTWTASALFLAVCTWWQPVPGVLYRLEGVAAWIGYAVQLAGVVLTAAGARAVGGLELAGVRPILRARAGLPQTHVPLETRGAYRFVRHPVYLAWILLVFGAPVMSATRFVFAALSTAYLALAIPWEERGLIRQFGEDYERYRRRVRWRMLPFLY